MAIAEDSRDLGSDNTEPEYPPHGAWLWSIRLLLAVIFAVITLLSIEAAGRVYIWWKHGVPGKRYGLWAYDRELGAIHVKNSYNTHTQTNNYGFRGREDVPAQKPPGSMRIICYGGSMTFCYNLADGETWPEQLQESLRRIPGHEQDQVLNGGHICWSTGHLYRRARRELPDLKPDVVIIYSGVNETTNAGALRSAGANLEELQRNGKYGLVATNYDQCRWGIRNSVLMRYLHYRVKTKAVAARAGEGGEVDLQAEGHAMQHDAAFLNSWEWHNYLHELEALIDLVRKYDGTPVFVVECGTAKAAQDKLLRFSEFAEPIMRDRGVIVCDPRPAFEAHSNRDALFHTTGVHVSSEGAKLLASEILKSLEAVPSATFAPHRQEPPT